MGISRRAKLQPLEPMNTHFVLRMWPISKRSKRERGLSLVELMVALSISLFVLYVVSNLFIATKGNTRLQAGVSRANESAQISTERLAREIRHTAYIGCPQLGDPASGAHRAVRDSLEAGGSPSTYSISQDNAVRVLASGEPDAPPSMVTGSPAIDVVHGANYGVHLVAKMADRGGAIHLTGDPGLDATGISNTNGFPAAIISACTESSEIFEVSRVQSNPWRVVPKNILRVPYTIDSRVMPAARTQFFIAPYERPTDERSTFAIFSRTMRRDGVNWNPPEAIAYDVRSMNLEIHIDSDGDYQSDTHLNFGTTYDPKQVVGLTLHLIFETPSNVRGTEGQRVARPYATAINIRARVS